MKQFLQAANACCHACFALDRDEAAQRGVWLTLAHMIVCPLCGDKRCPKAADHENECQQENNRR